MEIRRLSKENRFNAQLISAFCFHMRIENQEEERLRAENSDDEDWGAFSDDGRLMAHIINNHFSFYIDGTLVKTGGIGAVSTLPEFRREGAIRAIFRELLAEAYRRGEVISALYPFNHEFYRKQGYEIVTYRNDYTLHPEMLEHYHSDLTVSMRRPDESIEEYLSVYNKFVKNYNLSMPRDEKKMREHVDGTGEPFKDRLFSYLFSKKAVSGSNPKNEEAAAFITFKDVKNNGKNVLSVEECAWTCPEGFHAILSFLGRFEADYDTIELPLPAGIDLLRIIRSRRAYDISKKTRMDFMVRVINVRELLSVIRKPKNCNLMIRVNGDTILPQNNGLWHVQEDSVSKVYEDEPMMQQNIGRGQQDTHADMELDVRVLGLLAVGAAGIEEAMLMPGTFISHDLYGSEKEYMVRHLFAERPIFIHEAF